MIFSKALEALTGGVVCEIDFQSVNARLDHFWELLSRGLNKGITLVASTSARDNWQLSNGLHQNHSHSVLAASTINGVRLLKIRDPHGLSRWEALYQHQGASDTWERWKAWVLVDVPNEPAKDGVSGSTRPAVHYH